MEVQVARGRKGTITVFSVLSDHDGVRLLRRLSGSEADAAYAQWCRLRNNGITAPKPPASAVKTSSGYCIPEKGITVVLPSRTVGCVDTKQCSCNSFGSRKTAECGIGSNGYTKRLVRQITGAAHSRSWKGHRGAQYRPLAHSGPCALH